VYWAHALAEQTDDGELATLFGPVAKKLADSEEASSASSPPSRASRSISAVLLRRQREG